VQMLARVAAMRPHAEVCRLACARDEAPGRRVHDRDRPCCQELRVLMYPSALDLYPAPAVPDRPTGRASVRARDSVAPAFRRPPGAAGAGAPASGAPLHAARGWIRRKAVHSDARRTAARAVQERCLPVPVPRTDPGGRPQQQLTATTGGSALRIAWTDIHWPYP
jgi:hypothetical protein